MDGLLGRLPDAVFVGDHDGITWVNEPGLKMLGYDAPEQLGSDLEALIRELDVRDSASGEVLRPDELPYCQALRGQAAVRELKIRHRRTGCERVLRCTAAPMTAAGNQPGALVIATDVTDALEAAADLKRRADFEQQLIGIVSHDLRNPLQVVRLSAASALRHAGAAVSERRPFERILASSDRALRMLDDLLDFTGIRMGGGISIQASAADLSVLASEVVEDVVVTRPERVIALDTRGDCRGSWDADRLRQVLQNLVVNALQHTTEEIPARVSTRAEDSYVICEVHNGGTAISEQTLAHLFEPFQRGTRGGGPRGMGLGLYIASHIVQAHGGTLSVRSSSQAGTTFTVRLPRVASNDSQRGNER